jgi:hypothetical protein
MQSVRSTLLEKFDEEVRDKLKVHYDEARAYLNAFEQKLWKTTQFFLKGYASFSENEYAFTLKKNPFPDEHIYPGPYMILKADNDKKKSDVIVPDDTNIYRIGHKLAQRILNSCKQYDTPISEVVFDYSNTNTKITVLEKYLGCTGWMKVVQLSIHSFENEDHLLLACIADNGDVIEKDIAERLFSLNATIQNPTELLPDILPLFKETLYQQQQNIVSSNAERNREFFDTEMDKLDQWAEDMKIGLEKEIKDLDAEIKLRKSEAKKMMNLEAKVKAQRLIKELEKKRSEKRKTLYAAQDDIDEKKDDLLSDIERRLKQHISETEIFNLKWKII